MKRHIPLKHPKLRKCSVTTINWFQELIEKLNESGMNLEEKSRWLTEYGYYENMMIEWRRGYYQVKHQQFKNVVSFR